VTLQLNPDTTDDYESKTFAEMRQMVFDGLGFIDPLSNDNRTLLMIRTSIVNRLGLAVALLVGGDTFATVLTNTYNACGFAALGTHPPGVDTLLTDFINQAQQMLFRRIELDKGSATLPVAGTISIDSALVQSAAIALAKAHFGQPDAQSYGQQAERYLADLTQRTPPNIVGQINAAVIDAHNTILRRYELGRSALGAPSFGTAILGNYTSTASDGNTTIADDQPVELLALANLKTKIGQPDAKAMFEQYEQYMSDVTRRQPPNATSIVNNQLKITQQTLYRKYDLFRMERWWTWDLVAGQRFYGTFDANDARSVAPTGGLAVIGNPVTGHEMVDGRGYAAHAVLRNGKVIYAGGWDKTGGFPTTVELFDPTTGQFSLTGSMSVGRYAPAYAVLADGRFFVAGGFGFLTSTEIYDPNTGVWTSGPNLSVGRYAATAVLLADSTVLIAGGSSGNGAVTTNVAEIYNPQLGTITTTTGTMVAPRQNHTMSLLPNGNVLIAGGGNAIATALSTAEIYNITTGLFAATGSMGTTRSFHTATVLTNGTVLIAGGQTSAPAALSSCETYSLATGGTFTAAGAMPSVRFQHEAILLDNGDVLAVGGFTTTFNTSSALYDISTATWGAGPTTPVTFGLWAQADNLQDGRVLVAGGSTSNLSSTIQNKAAFYDEDANVFSLTGSLTQGTVFYQITAYTANGESLPGTEFTVTGVPSDTSVILTWTAVDKQPFVLGFKIYGRVTGGTKQLIATVVGKTTVTYTDEGTIPPDGALPTENNTQGPGNIDPRHVTWVGLSFNDNVWNPLIKGIPPMAFGQNINGVPTNYEIRQALEIWPAPTTTDWKVQIKGYFEPQVFESDDDETTLDWQAIYLWTLADAMPRFKTQRGQPWFSQLEIAQARDNAMQYIKHLVAGTHMTARYVPGVILERNAVRPVLVGPYVGYP
jgi:hypothetical protein